MFMNLCNEPEVLTVIYIAKIIIKLACYVTPLLLIIRLMITFLKVIVDNKYTLDKSLSDSYKRIIAAIVIVLIPTLVGMVISFTGESNNLSYCMNNATPEIIAIKSEEKGNKRLAELAKIEEERIRKAEEEEARRKAEETTYSPVDPNSKFIEHNPITTIDIDYIRTDDFVVPLYDCGGGKRDSLPVNSKITYEMHSILNNVARYVNENSFIGRFEQCGAYVYKEFDSGELSRHAYGLAIDLFNQWEYTDSKTNKTYKPYDGQGPKTWNNYKEFICNVCNGQENCRYNINYVIYHRYFEENGWCWGGSWGSDYFDPMHFEIPKNGYCSRRLETKLTCN